MEFSLVLVKLVYQGMKATIPLAWSWVFAPRLNAQFLLALGVTLKRETQKDNLLGVSGRQKENNSGSTRGQRRWLQKTPCAEHPQGSFTIFSPSSPPLLLNSSFSNGKSELFALTLDFHLLSQECDRVWFGLIMELIARKEVLTVGVPRAERTPTQRGLRYFL